VPFASADGRHVVIVVSRGGDLPGVAGVSLFRLTVSPDGRPEGLGRVSFASTGVPVTGADLSPDGKMLALSLVHQFPPGLLYGSVEVINLATGATRTWTGRGAAGYWPGVPSWAGDDAVAVPWWHDIGHGMLPAVVTGVRTLDPAAPSGSLLAARLVSFPAPVQGLQSVVITPGGDAIIASSCHPGQDHTATARIAELSAATGQLVRVLRTQTARFRNSADAQDAITSMCQVLSVAGHGSNVLAQAFTFGRISSQAFTRLPGTTPRVLEVSAAW
jgi:hypothetical protein